MFCISNYQKNIFLLPWLVHFSLESSAFLAILGLATAGLYNMSQLPGNTRHSDLHHLLLL